jgi:hypothetical protein
MYTPVYWRLDALCSLSTKGHCKGSDQDISLPSANIRTTAPAEARRRQVPAQNNKLLAEQARGEGGDVGCHVSLMLVFRA